LLLQLQDLILKLSLLNFKQFKVTNITRFCSLITKIAKKNLKTITTLILINKKNNAKNYLYIKVSINLQY